MALPLEYLNSEELKFIENGQRIPTLKRNLDRYVLSLVAEVSFADILRSAILQTTAEMIGSEIAGKEYFVDMIEFPLNNFWDAELEFGFDYDYMMANRGLANVRAVRIGLSPTATTPAGDNLTDKLNTKGLQTYHEFTPINNLWTPYQSQEDPNVLANLLADVHRSLPNATLPGQQKFPINASPSN